MADDKIKDESSKNEEKDVEKSGGCCYYVVNSCGCCYDPCAVTSCCC